MARRRKRRSRRLSGAARGAKAAPRVCKTKLSSCMKGRGSRAKASRCMRAFNRCRGVGR